MRRKGAWIIIFLIVFSIFNSIQINNSNIIKAQVWENEYGKLEVWPDTSTEMVRQKQWATLTWYKPDNTLTVAFAFDKELDYGKIYRIVDDVYIPVSVSHVKYNNRHYYIPPDFNVIQNEMKQYYWEYDAIGSGKWDLYCKLASDSWSQAFNANPPRIIHLDPWWSSEWNYAATFYIDNSYIDSTLTNFPVLFNLSTDITVNCQADGGDLRFLDSSNTTEYTYEIEEINSSSDSSIWVNVTSISSSALTEVNVYYGNAGATDGWSSSGVWDSDYIGVYHLNSTSSIFDSSDNSNDGTAYSSETSGKIGQCQDFELDDADYILLDSKITPLTSMTLEAWLNPESDNAAYGILTSVYDTDEWANMEIRYYRLAGNNVHFSASDSSGNIFSNDTNTSMLATDGWYYVTASWDGTNVAQFLNTTQDGTTTGAGTITDNANAKTVIGAKLSNNHVDYDMNMDGLIDELRISSISRSSAWLKATFHTCNKTIGFLTYDPVQSNLWNAENFTATTESDGDIALTWILNNSATHTYIETYSSASWSRGTGTFLYNDTGSSYTHSNLGCGSIYYYLAWSFNSTSHEFSSPVADNNISCPGNPTGVSAELDGNNLIVSWTKNTHADKTTLVRKDGSTPTGPADGTVIYNDTGTSHTDTNVADTYKYMIYSWNDTVDRHSGGTQVAWGGLIINVYDENTSLEITGWNVFIVNSDKTSTYENLSNNNPLTIEIGDLPYGTNTMVWINCTNYTSRIYYMDIALNTNYNLNAYLAISNETLPYVIRVVDESLNPIDEAKVYVKRYINDTVGYRNVSILLSDSYGECTVYLIPNELYAVEITKDGYQTTHANYHPDEVFYGIYYPKTFKLYYESLTYKPPSLPYEEITFTVEQSGTTLYINFTDNMSMTFNTHYYITAINPVAQTTSAVNDASSTNTYTITDTETITATNDHVVTIWYNHSYFDRQVLTITTMGTRSTFVSPVTINTLLGLIVGYNPFGWGNFLMFLFLIAGCYYSDGKHSGETILFIGGLFLFINVLVGFNTTLFTVAGGVLPTLFIIIGILVMWGQETRKVGGQFR